ncbi:hypothetical protein ACFE04_018050 [Oxalis oulophora]
MSRIIKFRDIIGIIKDKASQSKAKAKSLSLHLALLRATTHDPFTPPNPKHISAFLSFGHSSRTVASAAIESLMDRLQMTRDASVAVKCLITVHHIIKHGSFILQDQLSVYPSTGGRNNLKFSDFRDNTTPVTWELSSWIRWYALYLENLLSTSRVLGFFLCSTSSTLEKDQDQEKVSTYTNLDLLGEFDSLITFLEVTCRRPDLNGNNIVEEIIGLVNEDYLSAINDVSTRVDEFNQRLSCLTFGDSVELACCLKRLKECKEKLLDLCNNNKKDVIETLWACVDQLKDKVEIQSPMPINGKFLLTMGGGGRSSESDRFGNRVFIRGNAINFSSARFGLDLNGICL